MFSSRGIEEDDLGEIKDFNVSHQSLDNNVPYSSLPAMLSRKNDFDSHVNSVTLFLGLQNLVKRRGEFACFALRKVLLFLM